MRHNSIRVLLRFASALLIVGVVVPAFAQQAGAPAVGVVQAERRPITTTFDFVGRVEAIGKVDLRARVTGFLQERAFEEGTEVTEDMIRHALRVGTLSGKLTPVHCGSSKEFHGVRLLLDRAGLRAVAIEPEGGYFAFLGDKVQAAHRVLFAKDRRLVWRVLFLVLQPFSMLFFTVLLPALCIALDPLDRRRAHTTGFLVVAEKP